MTRRRVFFMLLFMAIAVVIAVWPTTVVYRTPATAMPTLPPTANPASLSYGLLYTWSACERLFGLSSIRGVVASAYSYESNLTDGSPTTDDVDCMLPYGAHERVIMPGFSTDRYAYDGAVYVTGSGWVQKWIAPNGGHMAFAHLVSMTTSSVGMPRINVPQDVLNATPTPGTAAKLGPSEGDDAMARFIGDVSTHPTSLPQLGAYPGGSWVSTSGWPSSYLFSNNSCGSFSACQSDAHLCIILDQRAADWLYSILIGTHRPPPTPKPVVFPLRLWQHWCKGKHGRICDPAYVKHRLTWAASIWWKHEWLGGKIHGDLWYGPTKGRRYGYSVYRFEHGRATCWPHYKRCMVSRT